MEKSKLIAGDIIKICGTRHVIESIHTIPCNIDNREPKYYIKTALTGSAIIDLYGFDFVYRPISVNGKHSIISFYLCDNILEEIIKQTPCLDTVKYLVLRIKELLK